MYLKAIEIVGFKSFADRSRLDFEQGVTCVVGPNGCGKSNIVDSVRWAIGEMSWKSLRSASMVDIIFNGTARRAPLNLAQVNMIFDNTSRKLPLDFNEISVSRKIFRSGESEYFLNKVQCRLKDIRDLFLDTGIGGEGYAIIDQGGVDAVLSANAEQRREMFEEVAGVSKYKAKRQEALNRLDRVDLDIARLSDTVALIDEQIKKLDSEAKKARLYQKYREELKESEIAISLQNIKEFDAGIVKDSAELEPLIKNVEDLNNSISAIEGQTAALDLNLAHKQKQFNEFNEKTASSKYQIGVLEGQVKNAENLTGELSAQAAYASKEGERSSARLKELLPVIDSLKEKLNSAQSELEPVQAGYNDRAAGIRTTDEEIRSLDQSLQKQNTLAMAAMQAQMECSNRIALEESSAAMERENLITLEKSGQGSEGNIAALRAEVDTFGAKITQRQSALESVKTNLNNLEHELKNLQQMRNLLSDQLSGAKAGKAALAAKLGMIQSQGKNDPYWVGTQLVLESGIAGVDGTLRKKIKFAASATLAVEEALGKYLDSVLVDTFDTAAKAVEYLKTKGKARCKILVLSAVPAAQAGGSLKGLITAPAALENLINHLTSGYDVAGADVKGAFWLSGGAADVKTPEAYWGEEESVKEEIAAKTEEEEKIAAQLSKNASDIAALEENMRSVRQKMQEDSIALNTVKNELAAKQNEIKNLEHTLSLMTGKKEEMRRRMEGRSSAAAEQRAKLEEHKKQEEDLKRQTEEIKNKKVLAITRLETLRTELNNLNTALYDLKIKKSNIELDLKGAELEQKNILEAAEKRTALIASASERLRALADEKLKAEAALSTTREALAALEIEQAKMAAELTALKKDFDEKTEKLNNFKKRNSELQLKAHDLENALINYRRQRTTVVNHLFESWNITPEEAAMKFDGVEIDHDRVKMMRKRIENMGAVNMTAPEEYDALTERNNFLKKQIEDLNSAKADLKNAIAKINATTKENFKYTFEQVRGHFKNIYQTLFRGGEADLVLTDPENLLETGIEIYAQPPGKKLLNIGAMSGGEKTLTALSLLFAFFTHNPSPFCIMDEADAALDEANVERYANLIKEFAKTTQFIVVTHNKRTMEIAQMLYGVTMEESGVSKLMSVNLRDEAAKAEALVG